MFVLGLYHLVAKSRVGWRLLAAENPVWSPCAFTSLSVPTLEWISPRDSCCWPALQQTFRTIKPAVTDTAAAKCSWSNAQCSVHSFPFLSILRRQLGLSLLSYWILNIFFTTFSLHFWKTAFLKILRNVNIICVSINVCGNVSYVTLCLSWTLPTKWGPYHHNTARPELPDGVYWPRHTGLLWIYEIRSREHSTDDGPSVWAFGGD
jgi:hypothetical protein